MPTRNVKAALDAFWALDAAQTRWDEAFSELSEKEETQLEKLLLVDGVTLKPHCGSSNLTEQVKKP